MSIGEAWPPLGISAVESSSWKSVIVFILGRERLRLGA